MGPGAQGPEGQAAGLNLSLKGWVGSHGQVLGQEVVPSGM